MLAIIIPYFKLAFFDQALQSLANQTDKRFHVYIGDDASPENPSTLLEKYKDQFDFSYHRFDENLGGQSLTEQWERCINLTKDESWIMILGDDDCLGENVIESWYENYDVFVSKSNLVRFATKILDQNSNTLSEAFLHPAWESATTSFWRKHNHLTRSSLSEYVFSRELYNKYGFQNFPLAWNSDDCAWLDFSDGKPIYTINNSLVYVGISASNISGKTDNIILKRDSQIAFCKYLISKKSYLFSKKELLLIIRKYEIEILKQRHLTNSEWLYLFSKYIKYYTYKDTKKFIKRLVNTILKRHE
ncbi:glycosyltransferase family 2 protein [Yeosuana marina]|uniref:glycosyltransferase family 2 protein n=1 Tax=Yeosuana marina TaxID=1565536 RepID=UPI0030C7F430